MIRCQLIASMISFSIIIRVIIIRIISSIIIMIIVAPSGHWSIVESHA